MTMSDLPVTSANLSVGLADGAGGRWSRRFAAALFLSIILVSGCALDSFPVVRIVNHSDVNVVVSMATVDGSAESVIVPGLKPGTEIGFDRIAKGCSQVQLVAKDSNGVVIARSPSPVCNPSTWVIESSGTSPGPS
jgi:hypothetical protein